MTQLGCVGVESKEALGPTPGVQGHSSSSDLTRRKKPTLSERLTSFSGNFSNLAESESFRGQGTCQQK